MTDPGWPPLSPAVDAATAVVFREFLALGRLQRQLMHRAFAKHCLHPAQAVCVWALAHHGELTQSELADILILSRPSVTRLLQRMERAGLVSRRVDEVDGRQVRVVLTPAGQELQQRLRDATAEYTQTTLALLPDADRAELARILPLWRRLAEEAQK